MTRRNGQYAEAHYHLGRLFELEGEPGKARQSFATALIQDPSIDEARISMASLALKLGGSFSRLTTDLQNRPRESEVWYRLGKVAVAGGRNVDGIRAFQRCLELSPKQSSALQEYGDVLSATGHHKAALSVFENGAGALPSDAVLHASYGRALMRFLSAPEVTPPSTPIVVASSEENSSFHVATDEKHYMLRSAIEAMERALQFSPSRTTSVSLTYEGLGDALSELGTDDPARVVEAYRCAASVGDFQSPHPWLKLAILCEAEAVSVSTGSVDRETTQHEVKVIAARRCQVLLEAALAYRGAAKALNGIDTAVADAEANVSRAVERALTSVNAFGGKSAFWSLSAVQLSGESEGKYFNVLPAKAKTSSNEVRHTCIGDDWWMAVSWLRCALTSIAIARRSAPRESKALQLIATAADSLARVPVVNISRFLEENSSILMWPRIRAFSCCSQTKQVRSDP